MKANYITSRRYELMNKEDFIKLDYLKIYNIEKEHNEKEQWVDVLNTFLFFIIEFNPTIMLEKLNNFM